MPYKRFYLGDCQKEKTLEVIKNILCGPAEVLFEYIHGSFIRGKGFRDIDIALYLRDDMLKDRITDYEIEMEIKLENALKYPVDVRVLNHAPLSFQYRAIKEGILLFERDGDFRVDFQVGTLDFYFDFAPFRKRYIKEMICFAG